MSTTHLSLAPDVEDFRRQFEQLSTDADALVAPLTDAQFNWRPAPPVWSIADCFEHLNTTARLYLTRLDEGIADAIRNGTYGEGPFSSNVLGRLLVAVTEPPPKFRLKTPQAFQPRPDRLRSEVMAAFHAYQVQYVDRLRQANGVDLSRARVSSPVAAWLRMPLGSGFALMAAHERRHLWQARNLTQHPAFPR
ncbi:MAG TPA: DinB family protein [Vicinamibacterales bacterium]|jgi:hypothetical protein|nr:DinB family protein [Vicinamibacterales bacterium]